jgi:hypothetical protein
VSDPQESRDRGEMASKALGATLAAVLGAATGPLAPFTTGAITPLMTRMAELIIAECSRKNNVVVATALHTSGFGPDEFSEILAGDPALMGLTQRILWTASITGSEHKLRILGSLLGGVSRGEKLDETGLIVAALTDLETPHIAVLNVLARPAPDEQEQKRATAGALSGGLRIAPERTGNELMSWAAGAWLPEQIQDELPLPPGFVLGCLSVLTRHNLAHALATYGGGQRFRLQILGARCSKP